VRWAPVPRLRQGGRPGALRGSRARAPQRHAPDRGLRVPAGDEPLGARGHPGDRRAPGGHGSLLGGRGRRVGRRHQLGGAPAPVGQRQTPPRAGQRLGRRGPPLHGPRELRAHGPLQVPEPDRVPEDARGERLLLRLARVGVPDGAHLFRRQARRSPSEAPPAQLPRPHGPGTRSTSGSPRKTCPIPET
jgi:hypothetical protein